MQIPRAGYFGFHGLTPLGEWHTCEDAVPKHSRRLYDSLDVPLLDICAECESSNLIFIGDIALHNVDLAALLDHIIDTCPLPVGLDARSREKDDMLGAVLNHIFANGYS